MMWHIFASHEEIYIEFSGILSKNLTWFEGMEGKVHDFQVLTCVKGMPSYHLKKSLQILTVPISCQFQI